MSDFTVLRSLDGYCLVLDKKRIAGGKPDYRGENVLVDWTTKVAYGPVDDLAAENAKLRELVRTFYHCTTSGECDECPINDGGPVHLMPDTICDTIHDRMRELGVESEQPTLSDLYGIWKEEDA